MVGCKKSGEDKTKKELWWLSPSRVSLICRSFEGVLLIISYLLFTICIDNCSVTRLVISASSVMT